MAFLRIFSLSLLLIINCVIIYSCNTTEPDQKIQLSLSVEDISCTEVWLKLKADGTGTSIVTISANDKPLRELNLTNAGLDTVIFIDSLLPNQQYTFAAVSNNSGKKEVTARTMDTTSHDFTWETFTFGGESGTCDLYDVAVINSDDIWAIGEIYIKGETGRYNAVHWDGEKWELLKIPSRDWGGGTIDYGIIRTLYAFSKDNIWFSNSADLIHWDGKTFTSKAFFMLSVPFTGQVQKMWGEDNSNIYCVGLNGALYNYMGKDWKKLESGTNTDMYDVWGIENKRSQKTEIYCAVSSVFNPGDHKILHITNGNKVDSVSWPLTRRIHSVWGENNLWLYASGGGVHVNKNGSWKEITEIPLYYSRNIRGTGLNNIYVVGDFGLFSHFNGVTWKTFDELYINGIYSAISIKENIIAVAGRKNNSAVVIIGKQN